MAIFHNCPVHLPLPGDFDIPLGVSRIAKVIVTGDTTLVADSNAYNLLLNDSADADTALDIPLFIMPSGTMVEDIGWETSQVWTESASFILGDTGTSDGWLDTVSFVATDTGTLGEIRWGSVVQSDVKVESTAHLDDTSTRPLFFQGSGSTGVTVVGAGASKGRVVYADSAYTEPTVVGLTAGAIGAFPQNFEYAIHIHQKGAVGVTGMTALYIRYNFAPMTIIEPSSNIGTTGD